MKATVLQRPGPGTLPMGLVNHRYSLAIMMGRMINRDQFLRITFKECVLER